MTYVFIFCIVICQLNYYSKYDLIILFKINKYFGMNFYFTFICLNLTISLRIKRKIQPYFNA